MVKIRFPSWLAMILHVPYMYVRVRVWNIYMYMCVTSVRGTDALIKFITTACSLRHRPVIITYSFITDLYAWTTAVQVILFLFPTKDFAPRTSTSDNSTQWRYTQVEKCWFYGLKCVVFYIYCVCDESSSSMVIWLWN